MRVFLPLLALAICQPVLANGPSDNTAEAKPSTIVIAHDRCVLSDIKPDGAEGSNFFGALLAIVAPVVVKISIDALVAELERVRTVKSTGSTEGYLFAVQPGQRSLTSNMPACITMVTGTFKGNYTRTEVNYGAGNSTLLEPTASVDEILNRLGAHIALDQRDRAAKIYSILEVRIVPSVDNTAFRYQPAYMRVFDLMPGNSADKQGLVYNISMAGPGASPDGTVYSLAPVSFGSVNAGFEVTDTRKNAAGVVQTDPALTEKLLNRQTGWLAIPGMSEAARASYYRDLSSGLVGGNSYMPITIKAEVIQTQKPSDAALLIAKILSGSRDAVAAEVGKQLAPGDDFADGQALLAAQAAVYDAQAALTAARNAENPNPDTIRSAEIKLEIAQNALANLQ